LNCELKLCCFQTLNFTNMIDKSKFKVVNQVLRTKDYTIFNIHKINRVINDKKVKRLARRMKKDGWLSTSVVIIRPNGDFIDGQHRVLAAMIVGCPVDFIIDSKATYMDIPKSNQDRDNWKPKDYVRTFSEMGTQDYRLLERYMTNFPELRQTDAVMMCRNVLNRGNVEEFQDGNFKVEDMKLAYEWGHRIVSLKYLFPKYYNSSVFVRALIMIFSKKGDVFNFNEFVRKLRSRPTMLQPTRTSKQYVQMIQDIYNYRRKENEKVNLMF